MQGNTVVINQPTDIDLLVQVSILLGAIELEFVRLDDRHLGVLLVLNVLANNVNRCATSSQDANRVCP